MDGTEGPPSDMVITSEGNQEETKPRTAADDDKSNVVAAATPTPTHDPTSATAVAAAIDGGGDDDDDDEEHDTDNETTAIATMLQESNPKYRGRGSIRALCSVGSNPCTTPTSTPLPLQPQPPPPPPPPPPGCGCIVTAIATAAGNNTITVTIMPTTGGQFELTVNPLDTVENLKKIISKKLKVAKERICLLHRDRQLREGTLEENHLREGSRLTLLPSVETGLLAQRPEQSVMQALESLNDSQVNDFLSGKAPLNLTMRLGDHMMLIQLQLSTVTPAAGVNQTNSNVNNNNSTATSSTINGGTSNSNASNLSSSSHVTSSQSRRTVTTTRSANNPIKLQNGTARTSHLISSLASALHAAASSTSLSTGTTTTNPACSNTRVTTASSTSSTTSTPYPPFTSSDTSSSNSNQTQTTRGNHGSISFSNNTCPSCVLHHHHYRGHHHHHHHHYHHYHSRNKLTSSSTSPSSSSSSSSSSSPTLSPTSAHDQRQSISSNRHHDVMPARKKFCTGHHHNQQQCTSSNMMMMDTSRSNVDVNSQNPVSSLESTTKPATLDTRALAEASRNLTQKLKQLSSEVFTSRVDLAEESARRRQGAIIESMHHHGKGVYSGTFSGTLNPALQDRHGRPKRDISTIIHILNDLLCATPVASTGHYRHHHRHSINRQQSAISTSPARTTTGNGSSASIGCHDSNTPGCPTEELSKENEATKGKMRRLRLVMEQHRAKRKARRQARAAPYTTQWAAMTPDADSNHDPNTPAATSNTATNSNTSETSESERQARSPEPVVA